MVIDTSCLIAIFLHEPERQAFLDLILAAHARRISAASVLESGMVIEARRGEIGSRELDLFLSRLQFEIVPVDAEQVEVARMGWRKFGKGNHPASLNFGDCFAYALAKISGEPLLAKGDDFRRTDIELC
jgi:ribonuclease VapC